MEDTDSLHAFAIEEGEIEAPVVDEPEAPQVEEAPEVAEEPVEAPETAELEQDVETATETAEEPETPAEPEPKVDEKSEFEVSSKGWPKPTFDNGKLGDPEYVKQWEAENPGQSLAKVAAAYWRGVETRRAQEFADFRKQYEDFDVEAAHKAQAVVEELTTHARYATTRAVLGMPHPDDPEELQLYAPLANALVNPHHPDHIKVRRALQVGLAGGTPTAPATPAQPAQPQILTPAQILEQSKDEYGDIDQAKFNAITSANQKAIARAGYEAAMRRNKPKQEQPEDPTEPEPTPQRDFVGEFIELEGLSPEDRHTILAEARKADAAGEDLDASLRTVKTLWDRVKAAREEALLVDRKADVARLRGASTSQPRSAMPDGGTEPSDESLYAFLQAEKDGP